MIIGITGNSGSGKTILSNLLKKEYNAKVINADQVVKELSMPDNIYYNEVIKEFGENILLKNREINKQRLADIIFSDNKKREKLNTLTFKYIVEEIKKRINESKSDAVIIDAPLLIESKLNKICDIVISIIADKNIKIKRVCTRDNIDKNSAEQRIHIQPDNSFYIKNSNIVIVNNENCNLEKQVKHIKEILQNEAINSKEVVIIQEGDLKIMQFKKLLEYDDCITHAFTLKPLDYGSNITYKEKKKEVDENYKKLCGLLGLDSKNIIRPCQTHTKNVAQVNDEAGIYSEKFKDVDGLITNKKNKVLSLAFADCMPIYLFDKNKKIIGDIHSGWQGTTKKIAKEAIRFIKEKYNSNPEDIICVIGPTIRKCHFEVKEDVRDIFYNEFCYMDNIDDIIKYNQETNSYFIDTVAINKNLLKEEGILKENIIDCGICTVCNSDIMHSFRKEGKESKRSTAIIGIL